MAAPVVALAVKGFLAKHFPKILVGALALVIALPVVLSTGIMVVFGIIAGGQSTTTGGRYVSPHGWSHPLADMRLWDTYDGGSHLLGAVDFPVASGTVVYAAAAGEVMLANTNGTYGEAITLRHDGGHGTHYAHLSGYLVKAGDLVVAGQAIGLSGNTGKSDGPHLHFETREGGWTREHGVRADKFMSLRGIGLGYCFDGCPTKGPEPKS